MARNLLLSIGVKEVFQFLVGPLDELDVVFDGRWFVCAVEGVCQIEKIVFEGQVFGFDVDDEKGCGSPEGDEFFFGGSCVGFWLSGFKEATGDEVENVGGRFEPEKACKAKGCKSHDEESDGGREVEKAADEIEGNWCQEDTAKA